MVQRSLCRRLAAKSNFNDAAHDNFIEFHSQHFMNYERKSRDARHARPVGDTSYPIKGNNLHTPHPVRNKNSATGCLVPIQQITASLELSVFSCDAKTKASKSI